MRPRALVYGDVDLNLIDGSAVWVQGMVQALARAGCDVTLVLKAPVRTGRLIDPLRELPEVTVLSPHEAGLVAPADRTRSITAKQAVRVLLELDAERPFDLVVARGRRLAGKLAATTMTGRLWTYLTDVPQSAADFDGAARGELTRIAAASRVMLCQTEELRGFLEAAVPKSAGKCVLFPPVVVLPDDLAGRPPGHPGERPLRLVYSGKFAPRWNTLEMTELPALLADRGVQAELHMIGDKVHDDPADPGYADRMRNALTRAKGVVWHGGHPRAEAMRLTAGCDVGLSWRAAELDAGLELSTKVLECGALGVPVLLNRNPMHERLLGDDYPLFAAAGTGASGAAAVADLIAAAMAPAHDPAAYELAAYDPAAYDPAAYELAAYDLAVRRCRDAAARYSLDAAAGRLTEQLARVFPEPSAAVTAVAGRRLRVAVAGHDLKFFTGLLDHLRSRPDMEVRVDRWAALKVHDEEAGRELIEWADVVICEWCGPNALWYARHKRPGQRLVVRLHRFELYAGWPGRLDIDAVDQVICVSPHYRDLTLRMTGWPAGKVTVVPNWVDDRQLDRPKLPGAEHHLGMIGIAPSRKRLDLALDVLEALRRDDPRFTLFIKSKPPWEYWWIWQRDDERAYYEKVFRRIRRSPALAGSVVFDAYGRDVAGWLRRIGFVLSTSDDESFHLAPAEGMAAGAVPALLPWPGADTIYDSRWIHDDPAAMAASIAATVREGRWADDGRAARSQVTEAYGLDQVCRQWTSLLAGD